MAEREDYRFQFHYRKFPEYESDEEKLQELMTEYQHIVRRLSDCTESGVINEYEKKTVIAMSKKVLEALTVKYSKVQEGVGKIMGGKILNYEAKDILNKGREEGRKEGLKEGRMDHLIVQVQKKLEKGKSAEKIADDLEEEVAVIEEIIDKLK